MKKITLIIIFIILCGLINCDLQKGPKQVTTKKEVVDLVNTWDKNIYFFTSKKKPVKTLAGLKRDEISFWGAEHYARAMEFFKAAGIEPESDVVNFIGIGTLDFNKMEKPPRLFITWAKFEPNLKGARRVILVPVRK